MAAAMSPRTQYALTKRQAELLTMDLMMNLDASTIAAIKQEFVVHGGEVDMFQFVSIMRAFLPEHLELRVADAGTEDEDPGVGGGPAEDSVSRRVVAEEELVANLCELFKEIDVNGDEVMEWDEFTSFIVDKAIVFRDDTSVDAIAGYTSVYVPPADEHANKKARGLQFKGGKLVAASSMNARKGFHNEVIDQVRFIPRINQLAVIEQRNPVIKMYDARTFAVLGELTGSNGIPEALEAFEAHNSLYLVASCADSTMALWDISPGSKIKMYTYITCWPTPHVQMSLCWCPRYTTLYSGSTTGLIHSWDIRKRKEISCMAGHNDIVMDLISIPQLDIVASASLDSTICMWDTCSGALRQTMRGHEKGVLSLAYCAEYRFLISAGFDHEALVWSPFVPSLLYKLKGHSTPLLGVRVVPFKPEVITASVDGQFRVWDLRSFKCVQTFSDEVAGSAIASFDHCPALRRIVSAHKQLQAFDQGGERQQTQLTDDTPITVSLFNATSMTILTASGRSVKIWGGLTGTLMRVYRDITESDITCICLDDRQRKFITGEANGNVRVYNYANGAVMKSMVSHTREVSALLYCDALKVVVSASWDRSIVVHDEMDPEKGVVLRVMDHLRRHTGDISCSDWIHDYSLVATGSNDKTVRIWDLETGKLEGVLNHPAEVVCVRFLAPLPLLATADSSGNLFIWGVRGSACKHALVVAWSQAPSAFYPSELAVSQARTQVKERMEAEARAAAEEAEQRSKAAAATALAAEKQEGKSSSKEAEAPVPPLRSARTETVIDIPLPAASAPLVQNLLASWKTQLEASYAACMSWYNDKNILMVGDERGQITCWDLTQVFEIMKNPKVKPGVFFSDAASNAREADTTTPSLYKASDLLVLHWVVRAHEDSISGLQYVPDPPCIVSGSYDKKVKAWDLQGIEMGTLCRAVRRGRNPFWNLQVDVEARSQRELIAVQETMEQLEKRQKEAVLDDKLRKAREQARERAQMAKKGHKTDAGNHMATGAWAMEAEQSRNRARAKKDRSSSMSIGMGASSGTSFDARQLGMNSARSGAMPSARSQVQRKRVAAVTPKRRMPVVESPLEATRDSWAGEQTSADTRRRVASALHSMSSHMITPASSKRMQQGERRVGPRAPVSRNARKTSSMTQAASTVSDTEVLHSIAHRAGKSQGSRQRGNSGVGSGAGAGAGAGVSLPPVATAASLKSNKSGSKAGGASPMAAANQDNDGLTPRSAASGRALNQFNPKTIEAAARLGALLSDLG